MAIRIGFRVDANEQIATGHLMRCIAIAKKCEEVGMECKFYLAEDKMTEKLQENHLSYEILHTAWNQLHQEISVMKDLIIKEQLQWLIVDSYQADAHYLTSLNAYCKVLYIDDLVKERYDIAAVLHYSYVKDDIGYKDIYKHSNTMVLAGADYIPLRNEFQKKLCKQRERAILITTGGTDPFQITQRILEHKKEYKELEHYVFHVVVGKLNQSINELEQLAMNDSKIILHQNINNMSDYMRQCECAVSAGGTTLYELCACQTPTVCFSFADNQRDFVRCMGQAGIMLCAGDAREDSQIEKRILAGIIELIEQEGLKQQLTEKMGTLVDSCGTMRIAKALLG